MSDELLYTSAAKGLKAGSRGFRPWAQLQDERGEHLARAREGRCGAV